MHLSLNAVNRASNHAGAATFEAMLRRWRKFWRREQLRQAVLRRVAARQHFAAHLAELVHRRSTARK